MRALLLGLLFASVTAAQEMPASPSLRTRWTGSAVSAEVPHPEYPRPQLVRDDWRNLNGMWELAIIPREAGRPEAFPERIRVPFPIESALSGIGRAVRPLERAWYRRTFDLPADWRDRRVRLHFGAVDWECEVWLDGVRLGEHRGGYDPFWFDATGALRGEGSHELVVAVWDPTDAGTQPRGKQVLEPHGIWYTPTSGIWQTVWMEPLGARSIDRLHVTTGLDPAEVTLRVLGEQLGDCKLHAEVSLRGDPVATARGPADAPLAISIPSAEPWSPDSPTLYDISVELHEAGRIVDAVRSYCGLREIAAARGDDGHLRLCLNGEPLFQLGLLDQGFWPDGLYTAPTDAALRFDLEVTKQLGFNLVRKHVKVEPARFYAWCDSLGLLVWQDIPSGDGFIGREDPDLVRGAQSARQFEIETTRILDALQPFPSIVMWVPFNEGWGQYDTRRITEWIDRHDPTRLVDAASGWTDRGVSDVLDVHAYPGPALPPEDEHRVRVLGEFGGLGLPVSGHTWADERNWGYRSFESPEELTDAYVALIRRLRPMIAEGLAAAVYTQTTDVEIEVNGMLTYDREVLKPNAPRVAEANRSALGPPPRIATVVPTSRERPQTWRFVTTSPSVGWERPDFDDSGWSIGEGGFGTAGTPGAVVGTHWSTGEIWLRRDFEIPERCDIDALRLLLHHDEDVSIFVDGVPAAELDGFTTGYVTAPITAAARAVLEPGPHVLAVHCRQTGGGQFVDVGIVEWHETVR